MRREDVFKSKYMKPEDLNDQPMIVTIKQASLETLKSRDGSEQKKIVLYFHETGKVFALNATNFDATAEICGDDTDDWPGHCIELYPTKTSMGGKLVACIRVRRPKERLPAERPRDGKPLDGELNDEIRF
jgi:hypothetical protein